MNEGSLDFAMAFGHLSARLKEQYDIQVRDYSAAGMETLHGFSDDRIADFEPSQHALGGRSIELRREIPIEFKLFSLLHLFGHIVQCNLSSEDARLALSTAAINNASEEQLVAIRDYELRASRYGVALLIASELNEFVSWFSDFWEADWRFLSDVYVGKIPDVPDKYADVVSLLIQRKAEYFVDGRCLLEPLELPATIIEHTKFESGGGFRIL